MAKVALPQGFEAAPVVLAVGAAQAAVVCLAKRGHARLPQRPRDLARPAERDAYEDDLAFYRDSPDVLAAVATDLQPGDLAADQARWLAPRVIRIQHHHAHVGACLAENGWPLAGPAVLGIALDAVGWGDDGALWGGEFLLADYRRYRRLASLAPVAMPGGPKALREPWRNLYAHVRAAMGWEAFRYFYPSLPARTLLQRRPILELDEMIATGVGSPRASSCGMIIDAAAAALGLCDGRQSYRGEAAARLEALAGQASRSPRPYPFTLKRAEGDERVRRLCATPMWRALFDDLAAGADPADVAACFHAGLAEAIARTAVALAETERFEVVALSGACFQNRLLLEDAARRLRAAGFEALAPGPLAARDRGLALGQAAIASARLIGETGSRPA